MVPYGLAVGYSIVGEGASHEDTVDSQPGQHHDPSEKVRGEKEAVEHLPGDVEKERRQWHAHSAVAMGLADVGYIGQSPG